METSNADKLSGKETDSVQCSKSCQYYTKGRSITLVRWGFIIILLISMICAVSYYMHSNSKFKDSYNDIVSKHERFCENILRFKNATVAKDSMLVVDNSMLYAIREESNALEHKFELLSFQLKEEHSGLTLWASVLMIIFLVFSIYAMYKIDEMQKQGHDSVDKIHGLHRESVKQFSDIDKYVQTRIDGYVKKADIRLNTWFDGANKLKTDVDVKLQKVATSIGGISERINTAQLQLSEFQIKSASQIAKLEALIRDKKGEFDTLAQQDLANFLNMAQKRLDYTKEQLTLAVETALKDFYGRMNPPTSDDAPTEQSPVTVTGMDKPSDGRYDGAFEEIEKQAADTPVTESYTEKDSHNNSPEQECHSV